jgi:hypothetical protein
VIHVIHSARQKHKAIAQEQCATEATEAMKIDQRGIETWKFYMVLPYLTVLLAISSTKSQQLSLGTCSVLGPCHLIHKGMFYKSIMAGWWFGT